MPQDSVKTRLGIVEEATWGTTPASALQLVNLSEFPELTRPRNTGRPDVIGSANPRRPYPSRALQEDGSLNASAVMQFANMRLFWEGALMNDQSADESISETDITFANATGVFTGTGHFGNIQDGDMVYVAGAGWTGAGNTAGWFGPVTSAGANNITIPVDAARAGNDVSSGTVTVDTRRLVDGDTPRSYSVEWEAQDLTTDFLAGTGFKVQSHTWSWATGGFANESCTLIGQAPAHGTSTIGTGGPTAAVTNTPMDCVGDFGLIYIDETATTYIATSWELVVNVELSPYYGIGNAGPSGISEARILPELNLTVVYDDNSKALLDDVEALTTVSAWWDVVDDGGNRVCFHLAAAKPETGDVGGGPPNTNLEFRNLRLTGHDPNKDSTSSYYSETFGYQLGIYEAAA